jgi:imidazoleglycerol phosphate dehydratase HisB
MNRCQFCGRFFKDQCSKCKPLKDTEVAIGKMRFSTKDTWFVMSLSVESYLQSIMDKMFDVDKRGQRELFKEYEKLFDKITYLNGITLQVINKLYGIETVNELVEATFKILDNACKQAIKLERK